MSGRHRVPRPEWSGGSAYPHLWTYPELWRRILDVEPWEDGTGRWVAAPAWRGQVAAHTERAVKPKMFPLPDRQVPWVPISQLRVAWRGGPGSGPEILVSAPFAARNRVLLEGAPAP